MAKPGQKITKEEFKKLKDKFQKRNPGKTKSVTFGKETFERIMSNPDTEYISVYMGETDEDVNTVVIVGLNKDQAVIYDTLEDRGQPCPPLCPTEQEQGV